MCQLSVLQTNSRLSCQLFQVSHLLVRPDRVLPKVWNWRNCMDWQCRSVIQTIHSCWPWLTCRMQWDTSAPVAMASWSPAACCISTQGMWHGLGQTGQPFHLQAAHGLAIQPDHWCSLRAKGRSEDLPLPSQRLQHSHLERIFVATRDTIWHLIQIGHLQAEAQKFFPNCQHVQISWVFASRRRCRARSRPWRGACWRRPRPTWRCCCGAPWSCVWRRAWHGPSRWSEATEALKRWFWVKAFVVGDKTVFLRICAKKCQELKVEMPDFLNTCWQE